MRTSMTTYVAVLSIAGLSALVSCSESSDRPPAATSPTATAGSGTAAPGGSSIPTPARRSKTATVVARSGEGFLEIDGGRKILHTKGTAYERGFQYGELIGDEVEGVLTTFPQYIIQQAGTLGSYAQGLLTPLGAQLFLPFFAQDELEEIRGIVDGMRARNPATFVTRDDLVFLAAIIDLGALVDLDVFNCSGLAVWGDISKDRKVYQSRNVDLMVGSGIENHAVVVMAKPTGGVAYVNPGWAGMIQCASGLNAHGIGVSQIWAKTQDKGIGRPWGLATREILANGQNVDDAIRVLRSGVRTYGSNFVFADRGDGRGGVPRAVSVETTKSHFAVFDANDPLENQALWNGQPYALQMPWAVYRADTAIDQIIRGLQTAANGPHGDPRTSGAYRNRYQGQYAGIRAYVDAGLPIGADEVEQISRAVAMRNNSLQCCVYENTDLELRVANSQIMPTGNVDACNEPYYRYSLDYYTPTIEAQPARTHISPGQTLDVNVTVMGLGRARALEIRAQLLVGTMTVSFGTAGSGAVILPERGSTGTTLQLTLPASMVTGTGKLVMELVEAGTYDLVDVSIAEINVHY